MALARYDAERHALVPTDVRTASGWLHVEDPTDEERVWIAEHLGVAEAFLDHALDVDEIARVDRLGDARLVVLRIPVKTRSKHDAPYRAIALGVLLTKGCILTVCRRHASVIKLLAKSPVLDVERHERLVIALLLAISEQFLACVREIDHAVELLEEQLQQSLRNREVYELLRYQKALVHLETALSANLLLVERLRQDTGFTLVEDDLDLLADALVELGQANEMVAISRNILGEMMDAFASIISNNLNVVMKVLTSLTILVALPNLIASLYGMNVALPGQHRPEAFAIIGVTSLVLAGVVSVIFVRKHWL